MADKLGEFSLAWKDENSDDWIDGDVYKHMYIFTPHIYMHAHNSNSCLHLYIIYSVLVVT